MAIELEVELAMQALLDDLHVKKAQEAAAEAEAQGRRGLGLVMEARVVQPQLGEAVAQLLEVRRIEREEAAEDDGHARLEAGQGRRTRPAVLGQRVADAAVGDRLDARRDEADLAGAELGHRLHLRREDADAVDLMDRPRRPHPQLLALAQDPVLDAHEDDDAEIGVVPAVERGAP